MKKVLALVLTAAFLLPLFAVSAFAEEESSAIELEPRVITNVDYSAAEWYESEETQTLFCAAAMIEIVLMEDEAYATPLAEAIASGRCFVSKSGLTLTAYFYSEDHLVLVQYKPLTKSLCAGVSNVSILSRVDQLMAALQDDGEFTSYNEIEGDDIITMFKLILDSAS